MTGKVLISVHNEHSIEDLLSRLFENRHLTIIYSTRYLMFHCTPLYGVTGIEFGFYYNFNFNQLVVSIGVENYFYSGVAMGLFRTDHRTGNLARKNLQLKSCSTAYN
jgi:hypothetical protein